MILSWMIYGTVVALLVGLAARSLEAIVRQRGRPVRALWIAALVGSLLVPGLASQRLAEPGIAAPSTQVVLRSAELLGFEGMSGSAGIGHVGGEPGLATASETRRPRDPAGWLIATWGFLSLALCFAWCVSHVALRRRQRLWRRAEMDGHEVWVSPDTGPAVIGFFRSRIVVPEWVLERDSTYRRLVLAHEAEHVRTGDPRLIVAAFVLCLALPWNAGLWWQFRRLRQAIELDCDQRVLARGHDARAYGRILLDISERGRSHRLVVAARSAPSFLERRITLMFTTPNRRTWQRHALGSAALAGACLAGACMLDRPDSPVPSTGPASGAPSATTGDAAARQSEPVDQPPRLSNADVVRAEMERLYPQALRNAGVRGAVNLEFVVGPDGRVHVNSVRVLTSPDPRLSEASIDLARHLVFRPAQRNGEAVETLTRMPISWGASVDPRREALIDDPRFANDTYFINEVQATRREALETPADRILVHTHLYRTGTAVGSQMNIVTTDAPRELIDSPVIVYFRDPGHTRADREAMRIEESILGCMQSKCGARDGAEPLVLINEVESDRAGMQEIVRSPRLRSVEYLKSAWAVERYGPRAADGALVITTH